MGIELVVRNEEIDFNEENKISCIQKIRDTLTLGTPVLVKSRSRDPSNWGIRTELSRIIKSKLLFLSGGSIDDDGIFNLEKGKRNFVYTSHHGNHEDPLLDYQIIKHWEEHLFNHELVFPKGGPNYTEKIIIGGANIKKEFSKDFNEINEEINAIKFARDAIYFYLNDFYHNLIMNTNRSIGDPKDIKKEKKEEIEKFARLKMVVNLLLRADKEKGGYKGDFLNAIQLGAHENLFKSVKELGIPANAEDYLIGEFSHPQKILAYVKFHRTQTYGGTLILPTNPQKEDIVEYAFSNEHVKKYYPVGLKD